MGFNRSTLPPFRTALVAALLLAAIGLRGRPLSAQANKCGFVKAADVAVLLGGSLAPTPPGGTCAWKSADAKRKLLVLTYSKQIPGEMAYAGARKNAAGDGETKVLDEAGIGDKAFSITASFGASFIMLKGGRMLQLQFWTGAKGTEKDRDALRVLARKAIAAF
jgi:hypothetical protein